MAVKLAAPRLSARVRANSDDPRILDNFVVRFVLGLVMACVIFGLFMITQGHNPWDVYSALFQGSLSNTYGLSEVMVEATPVLLCALAAAVPAQVGLVNVGAPGQIWIGAWAATWVAMTFGSLPGPVIIPLMLVAGFCGGAAWAGLAALARVYLSLNETISTLLMNYVAVSFVNIFIYGSWKDPLSFNQPYTPQFSASARLPSLFGTRMHTGIFVALIAVAVTYFVLKRTNFGYRMRAIGGNPEAARRMGLPIATYLIVAMVIGGGLAGLAGMGEVSGIEWRLEPGILPTEGFVGFLASWLALHNPLGILVMTVLLSIIAVGGGVLQTTIQVPAAAINVLIGLILFCVMAMRRRQVRQGR